MAQLALLVRPCRLFHFFHRVFMTAAATQMVGIFVLRRILHLATLFLGMAFLAGFYCGITFLSMVTSNALDF